MMHAALRKILSQSSLVLLFLFSCVDRIDFGVEMQRDFPLAIDGMTCAACVARVEKALVSVPGVTSASVNLATKTAEIHGTDDATALNRDGSCLSSHRHDHGRSDPRLDG